MRWRSVRPLVEAEQPASELDAARIRLTEIHGPVRAAAGNRSRLLLGVEKIGIDTTQGRQQALWDDDNTVQEPLREYGRPCDTTAVAGVPSFRGPGEAGRGRSAEALLP